MAPYQSSDVQVLLSLEKGEDALKSRSITFLSSSGSLQIGRASKTERKQLVPAADNLWISNPVISRDHALLSVETDELDMPLVYLEDSTSSHGTFVNGANIKGRGKRKIDNGDEIQFGAKVSRGEDEFGPPVYKVMIKSVLNDPAPQSSSTGRSISVPDEISDESEMDESDSDAESTDSHSSPPNWAEVKAVESNIMPGSLGNPFTVEDEPANIPEIIDLASREPSEEYEPSPNIHLVQDTYAQEYEEEDEFGVHEPNYDDLDVDEPMSDSEDNPPASGQSPVYTPTSPLWTPLRHPREFAHENNIQLPSVDMLKMGPPNPACGPHVYFDGPFAQADIYSGEDIVDSIASQAAEERVMWSASLPPFPAPAAQSLRSSTSVTVSTQDLLDAGRVPTIKNDMSIKSIINHTTVAGTKRKANEISEDEPELEVTPEAVPEAVDETIAANVPVNIIAQEPGEVLETKPEVPVVSATKRPTKRLRTFASHVGAFALGSVAVVAGLMSLPDNYFN